jgi:broad specificity phosphatase PhoE
MYTITLLRHAQSLGNIQSVHQGQSEFPLSEVGRHQSLALAERWEAEGRRFDRVFCSPLERACETCEIINAVLGAPVEKDRAWAERDLGALTGLTHAEASQQMPPPPFLNIYEAYGERGEGQWALFLRAGRAVQNLLSNPPGDYLVVSHRAMLGMTLYAILGIAPQANFHGPRFQFENTGFADLSYNPANHQWRLHSFNDLRHLEGVEDEGRAMERVVVSEQ